MTGLYFLITAFTSVVNIAMDFGLSPVLIRESARMFEKTQNFLNDVVGIKIILCLIVVISGSILITVLDYPVITRRLVYMAFLIMLFETFSDTFYACLRANHAMKYESTGLVAGQVITVVFGSITLYFHPSVYLLIIALLLNQMFNFFYSLRKIINSLNLRLNIRCGRTSMFKHIRVAIPFFVAAAFQRLLAADTFVISSMTDNESVGLFSIPSTMISTLQFIPYAVTAAIFPALSNFFVTSNNRLKKTFDAAFFGLFILVCPIAVLIFVMSPELIEFVFSSKYLNASDTLSILGLSLIPLFVSFPLGSILDACNKQSLNTMLLGVTSFIHLSLALLLVPWIGTLGIAYATLISYLFLFYASLYFAGKIIDLRGYVWRLLIIGTPGLLIGLIMVFFKTFINPVLMVMLAILLYSIFITLLKYYYKTGLGVEHVLVYLLNRKCENEVPCDDVLMC